MTEENDARELITAARAASLGTLSAENGLPYVSLVTIATDAKGYPILLLSGLADHTKNLAANPRASLLIEKAFHLKNPQTGPRITLQGTILPSTDAVDSELFLKKHPSAQRYASFADFGFFKMAVEKAHYVGGFGTAVWLGEELFR